MNPLSILKDNDCIWTHSMGATPSELLMLLPEALENKKNLTLMQLHTENSTVLSDPKVKNKLRSRCFFVGGDTRDLVNRGDADYVPIFLSEIPKLFRRKEQRVDVALIQVSPPDRHGMCTLGISVEATRAAVEMADRVIAHINPKMPRTHGDAFIPFSHITTYIEKEVDLPEHNFGDIDEVSRQIGANVASLIEDKSCLQMGIGAIPNAVLENLGTHKDLGVHTEMFSDGLLPLIEKGVITGKYKKVHPGKIVTGFAMGSRTLYNYVDDNPEVVFLDIEYVNDTHNIRRNPRTVSINSALQVDLSGQVCADSMGTRIYSGVGGQMDFVRGASLSDGGKAIIALPSTAKNDTISRISCFLSPGSGVVTTRAHAQYIVTEYGVAHLRGKSIRERAEALIKIAHPKFREQLRREASEQWGVQIWSEF